ncbi:MAG TPA: ABC transporter permease [Candidatus Angelobacter sp.]|nr:ABC transporter permease [Candidatus Angelobacter sp.]
MSTAAVIRTLKSLAEAPWQLWASQFMAILRIEIKKNLWMRRSIWIYLLAFAPTVMFGVHALFDPSGTSLAEDTRVFAYVFQIFYLRVGIFFGCMGLFTWLFRGEVVEKSLHYYFLSPVRRQLLVVAKFVAGLIASSLVFGSSVLLCFTFAYGHFGKVGHDYVFNGPGFGHLMSYLLVTVLACLGFGSLFLALSLVFKNPILPGIAVLLWETFHAVAPPLLQKLSVSFYLAQLCPVTIAPDGIMALFTVIAEPVSPWLAIPGLICLSIAILVFACMRIRRTEVSYLAD